MFLTKVLKQTSSKFNTDIKVVKSLGLGTYIQVNRLTQSGGVVESIWKYTLKRIKTKKVKTVLILGLGGGTVAKLLRIKYPKAKIVGVEIDPLMVELGNIYLGLKKSKVDVRIQDAFYFIKGNFDLTIVDIYCGDKYPKKFEDEGFLRNVKKHMSKNGIVIFNRLYYKEKKLEIAKFNNNLGKVFKEVMTFNPPANMMFICKA